MNQHPAAGSNNADRPGDTEHPNRPHLDLVTVPLGRLIVTTEVKAWRGHNPLRVGFLMDSLSRHEVGDWGQVETSDADANNAAYRHGGPIVSTYSCEQTRVAIRTEADRSRTTVTLND